MKADGVEIGRITITRQLTPDGSDVEIRIGYSDGLPLIDAVGMIAFAQAVCLGDYLHKDNDDEEGSL